MNKYDVIRVVNDAKYAAKVIKCAFTRYVCLQWQNDDGWQACGLRLDPDDGGALYPDYDLESDPYFVCALFGNGAHVPLPLVIGEWDDIGILQRAALRLTQGARSFQGALVDCAYYANQFDGYWEKNQGE